MSQRDAQRRLRAQYPVCYALATRWMDNDIYGHVNNVHYYSFIDTVVNRHLIEAGGLDPQGDEVIGVAVESGCRYFAPVVHPAELTGGLCVEHLGARSVRYGVGIFDRGNEEPAAQGFFVHVFVDRASFEPVAMPETIRAALAPLRV